MARSRNIKPGFFKNDQLAQASYEARLLFIGLWCLADREGRLEDRPLKIKAELFPFDCVDIDSLLSTLVLCGVIVRYSVEEQNYIWIPKFLVHQNPHYAEKPSIIPPATSDNAKIRDKTEAKLGQNVLIPDSRFLIPETEALSAETSDGVPVEPKQSEQVKAFMDAYNEAFSGLWARPLKLTKDRRNKINARLKAYSLDDLLKAMRNIRLSDFHCGENDKGAVYATPEFICRNDSTVDKWLSNQPRASPSKLSLRELNDQKLEEAMRRAQGGE